MTALPRRLTAICAALLLAGCSTTLSGHGTAEGTSAGSGAASSSPSSPSPSPSSSSTTPPAASFPRPHYATTIGDPGTADMCRMTPLRSLRLPGLTPSYADGREQPGCIVRMKRGTRVAYSISTSADSLLPSDEHPASIRRLSGFRVRVFGYDPHYGDCEREIVAKQVYLTVEIDPPSSGAQPGAKEVCAGADRAVGVLAAAARRGHVPQLTVAHPSLTGVDFCDAAQSLDYSTLPLYLGMRVFDAEFGLTCALNADTQHSFIRVIFTGSGLSKDQTPMTVDGHVIYADSTNGTQCSFVSPQGRTSNGFTEELAFFARPTGSSSDALCTQAAQAMAQLIEATGLR